MVFTESDCSEYSARPIWSRCSLLRTYAPTSRIKPIPRRTFGNAYVGQVGEVSDAGVFPSLVRPIAEIVHTRDSVLISIGVPIADAPLRGLLRPAQHLTAGGQRDGAHSSNEP